MYQCLAGRGGGGGRGGGVECLSPLRFLLPHTCLCKEIRSHSHSRSRCSHRGSHCNPVRFTLAHGTLRRMLHAMTLHWGCILPADLSCSSCPRCFSTELVLPSDTWASQLAQPHSSRALSTGLSGEALEAN